MIADRHDAWDEETIDCALAEALSVQPSPDFRARVAARAAHLPPPHAGGSVWAWAGAAAAIVAAVAAGRLLLEPPPAAPVARPLLVVQPLSDPAGHAPSVARQGMSGAVRAATARVHVHAGQPAVFDPRERAAFVWFLQASREGGLPLQTASAAEPAPDTAETIVLPLTVAAIDVSAIAIADEAEGDPEP